MGQSMLRKLGSTFALALAAGALAQAPAAAQDAQSASLDAQVSLESQFDSMLGTELRAPKTFEATYDSSFERQVAALADGSQGRIGVYAVDLTTGEEIGVLADQRFPMASTSKVAIAATFLAGVDQGRWSLSSEFELPGRGTYISAREHLNLMITRSCNDCTDALLNAVGGPQAVNAWMRSAGILDFQLTRNIAALVREDGRTDPATEIDLRDSATPRAMGQLLAGIYQGRWLSPSSRQVLMNAMGDTVTGKRRMTSALPMSANLAHKTGTLSRTASDIGIFYTPDGRPIAAAIYVTGQSASMAVENGSRAEKLNARRLRDERIASITSALYNGFGQQREPTDGRVWATANYGAGGQ
ncbi:serine hydrolase [Citromicrobium bathyomarinum]|uniref:serine hydrolase n=1 Tax=Citromicrobium bathyomarinum TaxID=72174 RepID=UPI001E5A4751|nr:serine hydrolase [Citromicrobium bathyomarinum]MCD1622446.1 class A beta-lactamase-related serine hydrolase [Citromicrobium bathyomarinum]